MAEYVKRTNNPKMGRPKIDIDIDQFEKLCNIQCTKEEIAGWFNCSEDTIENFCKKEYKETFSAVFKRHSGKGKVSLRRNQFKLSETNVTMAIFLGKQYLGQKDVIETYNNFEDLTPLAEMLKMDKNAND
jgi:hypothetical protein